MESDAFGVGRSGNDEEARAAMRGAGVCRSDNTPARVVPQGGKVAEYLVEAVPKVPCDVLQQNASWS